MSDSSCVCGGSYDGKNCAHFLANWMIESGKMTALTPDFPAETKPQPGKVYKTSEGIYCCMKGRFTVSTQLRDWFRSNLNKVPESDVQADKHYFIWTDAGAGGGRTGHVYYGTKSNCVKGTGTFPHSKIEYYD